MPDLLQSVTDKLQADGWKVQKRGALLTAEKQVIQAKWLLGSRRVEHCLRLRFEAAVRTLTLQETASEVAVGMPPPVFSVTTTKQHGIEVREKRRDSGIGGDGCLDYGAMREWLEEECRRQGWRLQLSILSP